MVNILGEHIEKCHGNYSRNRKIGKFTYMEKKKPKKNEKWDM